MEYNPVVNMKFFKVVFLFVIQLSVTTHSVEQRESRLCKLISKLGVRQYGVVGPLAK